MRVYIAMCVRFEGNVGIIGVFSSEDAANRAVELDKKENKVLTGKPYWVVEDYELDPE